MTTSRKAADAARQLKRQQFRAAHGASAPRYTTDSGIWVENVRAEILPPFAHAAIELIAMVFGGAHNAPINWRKAEIDESSVHVCTRWAPLATWDFNQLTRLVVASHDLMIRVELSAAAPKIMELALYPRHKRSPGESISVRMPTLDDGVEIARRITGSREVQSPAWLQGGAP